MKRQNGAAHPLITKGKMPFNRMVIMRSGVDASLITLMFFIMFNIMGYAAPQLPRPHINDLPMATACALTVGHAVHRAAPCDRRAPRRTTPRRRHGHGLVVAEAGHGWAAGNGHVTPDGTIPPRVIFGRSQPATHSFQKLSSNPDGIYIFSVSKNFSRVG